MGQLGFFDLNNRYDGLDRKGDPLALLASLIPWETFRPRLKRALLKAGLRTRPDERRSAAGRKPWDEIVIFKALILQSLYTLSDEQAEYQIRDRLSFMRFLGLGLEDRVPDATTLWLYREALVKTGLVEQLSCHGRPNRGCDHRGGAAAAEHGRGDRDHQSRRQTRGLDCAKNTPERSRRTLDEEERPELFRLQEPHQH